MSNQVSLFKFENGAEVRVVHDGGSLWFVAKDVCEVLGLTDDRNHLKKLADDERRIIQRSNVNLVYGSSFPNRGANCVSESGLYKLIMRSDKPEARVFQDWVTGTVLPAIRKDGAYVMGEEKVVTGELDEDAIILKAMQILQRKVDRLKGQKLTLAGRGC